MNQLKLIQQQLKKKRAQYVALRTQFIRPTEIII